MQRWRVRHRDERPSVGVGLAFATVGLVAGLALGALLADRLGGVGGISARVRGRMRPSRKGLGLRADGPGSGPRTGTGEDDEDAGYGDEDEESAAWAHAEPVDGDDAPEIWNDDSDAAGEGEPMADDELEPFTSADPELEDRVLTAFTNDPVLCERAIDIGAVSARTIELTGAVYTDDEYEHATVVTRGVPGVETVVNRLSIRADDASKAQAARRYAAGDPRFTGARWENERVGTGRRRQGTSQEIDRHADPKVPLESRALGKDEAVRDAADDIPPVQPARTRDDERPPRGDERPPRGDAEAR
jgi:BON domain